MNIHKLIISLTVLTGISATGCLKEVDTQNPYVRNKGEAYMTVSTDLSKYPETVAYTL